MEYTLKSIWRDMSDESVTGSLSLKVNSYVLPKQMRICKLTSKLARIQTEMSTEASCLEKELQRMKSAVKAIRYMDVIGIEPSRHSRILTSNNGANPLDSQIQGITNYLAWAYNGTFKFLTIENPGFCDHESAMGDLWVEFACEKLPAEFCITTHDGSSSIFFITRKKDANLLSSLTGRIKVNKRELLCSDPMTATFLTTREHNLKFSLD